ncbi:MAG: C40 family peptidase [Treponema sp.]|jgi:cell wall-associated NlpC family hydrolase|nr:C40 family peptidase [Treponema sp.]
MDIKKYIGTPYKPHGRTLEEGLDCYGLALLIFRERGIKLPDLPYLDTETATNRRVMGSLEATIPNMPLEKPEPFCVIEFTVLGEPSHIGIYLEHGEFIHASRHTGVVIDRLYRWSKRVKGYYRVAA